MALVDWSNYLDDVRGYAYLDARFGVLHQGAALLTWVDSVDGNGVPTYRFDIDHPGAFSPTPTNIQALPDQDFRYVRDVATQTRRASEIATHAKIDGVFFADFVTERAWSAGDLAIVVVVASETALDAMVSAAKHLPLMRVFCDENQGDDPNYAPSLAFPLAHVQAINTWFGNLGVNGNPKYPLGLTATQVANFFGQYYPAITSAGDMSAWMQAHPRSDSIGAFGQIFEYAP